MLDENDKLLKQIGDGLYITRTLKVNKDISGTQSLSYLDIDL